MICIKLPLVAYLERNGIFVRMRAVWTAVGRAAPGLFVFSFEFEQSATLICTVIFVLRWCTQ